ncbi:MAG: CHAT domain-containing protein, partial [Phormidesmis sp.]
NRARDGGGVYASSSDVTLAAGTRFERNMATNSGGGLGAVLGSRVEASATTFADNAAITEDGGGLHLEFGATARIEDSEFVGNRAGDDGGGIYSSEAGAVVTVTNTLLQNNRSGDQGGGLYSSLGAIANITSSTFDSNISNNAGGGVAIVKGGTAAIVNSALTNNEAVNGGGLVVSQNSSVSATETTFTGNSAAEDGGAIYLGGEAGLQITESELAQNTAGDQGGALHHQSSGSADVVSTAFRENRAMSDGGAIANNSSSGTLTITDSSFDGNTSQEDGGAVYARLGSRSTIAGSRYTNNRAMNNGGGIYSAGDLTLQSSKVANNQADVGGGLAVIQGSATIATSQIEGNIAGSLGGGAYVSPNAELRIVETTFEGNQAAQGGGLFNHGTSILTNATLSGNAATANGGAIHSAAGSSDLTLLNSTISNNSAGQAGGGIFENDTLAARLQSTLVAANESAINRDVSGAFVDQGDNLIGEADGSTGFSNSLLVGTAAAPVNAKLLPLADNGGPTKTHLLQASSPAINAVTNNVFLTGDQRGMTRPVGAAADIGAVELAVGEASAEVLEAIAPNHPFLPVKPIAPIEPVIPADPGLPANPEIPSAPDLPADTRPIPKLETLLSADRLNPLLTQVGGTDSAVILGRSPNESQQSADNNDIRKLEQAFSQSFEDYWNLSLGPDLTFDEVQVILQRAQEKYKVNSAVVYAIFASSEESSEESEKSNSGISNILQIEPAPSENDLLNLALIMPQGELVRYSLPITRQEANRQVRLFRSNVSDPEDAFGYRPLAQQLYQWLLAPLEKDLAAQGIQNLMYALDTGLRTAPIVAMRDDDGFALERYGISVVPSMGLMQADFPASVRRATVAMGVDEFEGQSPLPAVPIELQVVQNFVPASHTVLNEGTTTNAIRSVQALEQPGILHLATHANFDAYSPDSSSIQLWNDSLSMAEFSTLDWRGSDLELLILSACSTALSSPNAELGFAGLAAAAGVDATVGSLWQVSDIGTLALMSEFYARLDSNDLRFEALRQAQLALLRGETRIENGSLITSKGEIDLPEEWGLPAAATLDHPFFWSAFTMVGNPW